jgi:hypothetical protein
MERGVGVVRDSDLELEDVKASRTLGEVGEGGT